MREIVKDILKEEEEARDKISKATKEAEEIISNAQEQAEQLVQKTILETKAAIKKNLEETEKQLLLAKENVVRQTRQEAVSKIEKKKGDIPRLAREVFSGIIDL